MQTLQGESGKSWYKACLSITGRLDGEWTVTAPERKGNAEYPTGWLAAFKGMDMTAIRAASGVYEIAPRQPLGSLSPSSVKRQKVSQE